MVAIRKLTLSKKGKSELLLPANAYVTSFQRQGDELRAFAWANWAEAEKKERVYGTFTTGEIIPFPPAGFQWQYMASVIFDKEELHVFELEVAKPKPKLPFLNG